MFLVLVPVRVLVSVLVHVDTVECVVSRKGGMGLQLLELAGGREQDDLGIVIVIVIVIVEEFSGYAQQAGIVPGD
jgi:hypothetical protein